MCVIAYGILDTQQHTSHMVTAMADTFPSFKGSCRKVISISEVHELLKKIYDILD